jgi:CTP:molybdopterin cytidylyltransferase MocA
MIDISNIYLAILAAGSSRRFGDADKLGAHLRGKMLGLHVSDRIAHMRWSGRAIICANGNGPCANGWQQSGYRLHINDHADNGMGGSVALAAKCAQAAGAQALMLLLADMPFVSTAHITAMLEAAPIALESALLASSAGGNISPPALIGRQYWDDLAGLDSDIGARVLLKQAEHIIAEPAMLADIDTPEMLAAYL